jgi:hypothetical protein
MTGAPEGDKRPFEKYESHFRQTMMFEGAGKRYDLLDAQCVTETSWVVSVNTSGRIQPPYLQISAICA